MELQRIVLQKLVIISFGLYNVAAGQPGTLYIQIENKSNWIEARNECFNQGGTLSNIDDTGGCNDRTKGKTIWTGNHQVLTPWLGKTGCFDLVDALTIQYNIYAVQVCYQKCGKPYFGHINHVCSCMRKIVKTPITNSRCLNDQPGKTVAWVYQSNTLDISNVDDFKSKNCVGARCTNRSLALEIFNCSSHLNPFCQNGTKSTTIYSWKKADQFCNNKWDFSVFNHKTICRLESVDSSNSYWTGYKRYWYESTSNSSIESIQSLSEVLNCSYMTCPNDGATAIHNIASCSEKLDGYECLVKREPKTSSKESSISMNYTSIRSKIQTTTESNADTSYNQHKDHVTSKQIVSSSGSKTTIMNTATSTTLEKIAKKPSYIVVILVSTVAALAIISSGVFLALCRVRRQGPFKRKEQEPGSQMTDMHDPNYHDFETSPHNASSLSHSNTAYNTHTGGRYALSDQTSENMQSDTASNNEYNVVVKDKKLSPCANDDNFDQEEENSSDIMNNGYDSLNQIQVPLDGNFNSKNIYDSSSGFRDQYDPTYNTTSQISGRNNVDNSVYDHT